MRRLEPADLLNSKQIVAAGAVLAMLRRHGFRPDDEKYSHGKGSHLLCHHPDYKDISVGIVLTTNNIASQIKAAEICLEIQRRKEEAEHNDSDINFKAPDDVTIYRTAKNIYVRSKEFPCCGTPLPKGLNQTQFESDLPILRGYVEAFKEQLKELTGELEFVCTTTEDGTLILTHPLYPLAESFPPVGASGYHQYALCAAQTLAHRARCFDTIFRTDYETQFTVNLRDFTINHYNVDVTILDDGRRKIDLIPKAKARHLATVAKKTVTLYETAGKRSSPEFTRNFFETFMSQDVQDHIKGIHSMGYCAELTADGDIVQTHPFVPGVKRIYPSPHKLLIRNLELIDMLGSCLDESSVETYIEAITAYEREFTSKCLSNHLNEALEKMAAECAPKVRDLWTEANKRGFRAVETPDSDGRTVTVKFTHRDPSKGSAEFKTHRYRNSSGKQTWLLYHYGMVEALQGLLYPAVNRFVQGQPLPGLPGNSTRTPFMDASQWLMDGKPAANGNAVMPNIKSALRQVGGNRPKSPANK